MGIGRIDRDVDVHRSGRYYLPRYLGSEAGAIGDNASRDAFIRAELEEIDEPFLDKGLAAVELDGEPAEELTKASEAGLPFFDGHLVFVSWEPPEEAVAALVVALLVNLASHDDGSSPVNASGQIEMFLQVAGQDV
jgi:hypothetical protein